MAVNYEGDASAALDTGASFSDGTTVVGAGADCVTVMGTLYVGTGDTISLTLGGNAPTDLDTSIPDTAAGFAASWVDSDLPAAGTRTLAGSGADGGDEWTWNLNNWSGVHQSTPQSGYNSTAPMASTPDSISVSTDADGYAHAQIVADTAGSPGGSGTETGNVSGFWAWQRSPGTGGSVSCSWTGTSGTTYQLVVVALEPAPTALSQAIGLATETDTAPGVTSAKAKAVGLPSETDSALAVTANRAHAAGLAAETDSALGVSHSRALAIALAIETDTALPLVLTRVITIGLAAETDTALGATAIRAHATGLASETDSALAGTAAKAVQIGLPSETDTAFGLTGAKAQATGLASETDSALSATARRALLTGLAAEVDSALGVTSAKAKAIALAQETDEARAVVARRLVSIALASETEQAFAATWSKAVVIGLAEEFDTAFAAIATGGGETAQARRWYDRMVHAIPAALNTHAHPHSAGDRVKE